MLRKVDGRKLVELESHLYTLVLNDMWVKWVSGMWGLFTIYGNYDESGLLFVDGLKWKKGTLIRGWREYLRSSTSMLV